MVLFLPDPVIISVLVYAIIVAMVQFKPWVILFLHGPSFFSQPEKRKKLFLRFHSISDHCHLGLGVVQYLSCMLGLIIQRYDTAHLDLAVCQQSVVSFFQGMPNRRHRSNGGNSVAPDQLSHFYSARKFPITGPIFYYNAIAGFALSAAVV